MRKQRRKNIAAILRAPLGMLQLEKCSQPGWHVPWHFRQFVRRHNEMQMPGVYLYTYSNVDGGVHRFICFIEHSSLEQHVIKTFLFPL